MNTVPFNSACFADLPPLPVRDVLPSIAEAVLQSRALILRAAPGAGKTTLVPLALARIFPPASGRILVLEPRRVAAIASAQRMAELIGQRAGEEVGYAVRGDRKVSAKTRIEVVTEGLFAKRLIDDPGLDGVSVIIFDEFHERSIHGDLALALSLELMGLRDDLSILVMSATMEVDRLNTFLSRFCQSNVAVIEAPGRQFPVDIQYLPVQGNGLPLVPCRWKDREALIEGTSKAVQALLTDSVTSDTGKTVLVFLPGRAEIEALQTRLGSLLGGLSVLVLHGSLSLEEQKKVLEPPLQTDMPRVVIATNIAETSLTVPGVGAVVDSGLVKVNRWHAGSGLDRLVTEVEDAFSADQRAGRAGRLGPGRAVRLWDADALKLPTRQSEILRSELSSLYLDCASLGLVDPLALPWLDIPPDYALEEARSLLAALGAIDSSGHCTTRGKAMARLGLDVRAAALVMLALDDTAKDSTGSVSILAAAVLCAALLAEGAGQTGSRGRSAESLDDRLSGFHTERRSPWGRRVLETAKDILARLASVSFNGNTRTFLESARAKLDTSFLEIPASLVPRAFPDSLAMGNGEGLFRLVSGREIFVEGLYGREPWLAILDADAGERQGSARLVLPVPPGAAKNALESIAVTAESWEWRGLEAFLIERRMARRLELSQTKIRCPKERLADAFRAFINEKGLEALPWEEEHTLALQSLERVRFFADRRKDTSLAVKLSAENLSETLLSSIVPSLSSRGPIIDAKGLADAIEAILDWSVRREFESSVPEFFLSPAGSRHRICWTGGQPTVSLRIQECFGLQASPQFMGVPLRFELLSPAQRPVQLTSDLANFWATTWKEVRKELRGRYPKHYWPEDPSQAQPTTRVRPGKTP